jgi:hypothetical protein
LYNYHILGRLALERQRELQREAARVHLTEMGVGDGVLGLAELMRQLGQIAQAAHHFSRKDRQP